jgi:hypothetical protein
MAQGTQISNNSIWSEAKRRQDKHSSVHKKHFIITARRVAKVAEKYFEYKETPLEKIASVMFANTKLNQTALTEGVRLSGVIASGHRRP